MKSWMVSAILTVCTWPALASEGGSGIANSDCITCHTELPDGDKTYKASVAASVHEGVDCLDCHAGIDDVPHPELVEKAGCGDCHEDVVETYRRHGKLDTGKGHDIPTCGDCHGHHDIVPVNDERSRVHVQNLPDTCGRCHEDIDLVKKHHIPFERPVEVFSVSVHGVAAKGGSHKAAMCDDCHSTKGTAHHILPPADPESSINHFNLPDTCGRCHEQISVEYWEGIHGQLAAHGETESPVCTDCHGEHGILATTDPRSPVSPVRLAEATCEPCHESARLNDMFGLPTGRLHNYIDTYHGLKSRAGDVTVANCSSCHGAHRILPSSDPRSTIHKDHLRETCGHCHPDISEAIANTTIHGMPGGSESGAAELVRKIYIALIVVIIGAMALHVLLDLRKHLSSAIRRADVVRMRRGEVLQHTLLMITFITLVITGFSLRFSEAGWVKLIFGWEGGFPLRGTIHRTAAVIFILTVLWHIGYLFTARGRQFLRDMKPTARDVRQVFQMLAYYLGRRAERPRFGRFSYAEKAEYWALVWGSLAMVITGLLLWFDNLVVTWIPRSVLDVMLVIHYYEAWLATLAILIWHLYGTVFNPGVYPMNPAWLTGKMPRAMHEHEHPEDETTG
jgi:formate dehydrogenase gamma subunit